MRITESKLRKMIRKAILEGSIKDLDTSGIYRPRPNKKPTPEIESMSPSDPDYDTVAEVISQIRRDLMFGYIDADEEAVEIAASERAEDYGVKHHFEYIVAKCVKIASQFT